ncbi:hypothetical protein P4S72_18340 [Vibrio sp. PP-XX7]
MPSDVSLTANMAGDIALLTALALITPVIFHADDPFGYRSDFVWPMLGPVLIALRYGFSNGLISILSVLFVQLLLLRFELVNDVDLPFQSIVGYVLLVMLCGEFSDWWENQRETETSA